MSNAQATLDGDILRKIGTSNCVRCGRRLDNSKITWLEYNQGNHRFYAEGTFPEDAEEFDSTGFWPFGPDCFAKALDQERLRKDLSGRRWYPRFF